LGPVNALVAAAIWAGVGTGVVVVLAGVMGVRVFPTSQRAATRKETLVRAVLTALAVLVVLLLTGWPVVAIGTGLGVWFGSRLIGGRGRKQADVERARAIARWTRLVKDTISGSTAIQQALEVTAAVAPRAIRGELQVFAARVRQMPLVTALELLRRDLDHPDADMVVVCLISIVSEGTGDAAALLARLAESIDSSVRLRERTEASRAGFRTSMWMLVITILVGIVGVRFLFGSLLTGYSTFFGQVWLLVVMAVFSLGAWLMNVYGRMESPERFSIREWEATR
jgi:Flp pilus assembly protein TadB